ncbi:MAG: Cytochrome c oxidase subunit 3 [Fimbriimonadaceae bacterium]|nr:Cytochrome c oxidase subunit 3 [Fimbriimonadaceae bacterium]
MAIDTTPTHVPAGHHPEIEPDEVFEQYHDLEQQNESYIVGMWTFLVTEVMFFGALFLAYVLYRWKYQTVFWVAHNELDWKLGGVNTVILLISSYTVARAVRYAQLKDRRNQLLCLGITVACAFGFLIIKYFEYSAKIEHHLIPGPNFQWNVEGIPANIPQIFFLLYFCMTGLHGIHVAAGILVIGTLMYMTWKKYPQVESYIPTEMIGLYWHFVDLVWIFLYPLFYLIPR